MVQETTLATDAGYFIACTLAFISVVVSAAMGIYCWFGPPAEKIMADMKKHAFKE